MDIHINFENAENNVWVRNVIRRDVSSETYNVWFLENDKINQIAFDTKQIKSVSVYKK